MYGQPKRDAWIGMWKRLTAETPIWWGRPEGPTPVLRPIAPFFLGMLTTMLYLVGLENATFGMFLEFGIPCGRPSINDAVLGIRRDKNRTPSLHSAHNPINRHITLAFEDMVYLRLRVAVRAEVSCRWWTANLDRHERRDQNGRLGLALRLALRLALGEHHKPAYRDAEDELVHKIFVPFDDVELSLAPWSIGSTEDTVPTITSWPDFCCLCSPSNQFTAFYAASVARSRTLTGRISPGDSPPGPAPNPPHRPSGLQQEPAPSASDHSPPAPQPAPPPQNAASRHPISPQAA
ncbi:hypothetical protein E8E15_005334 [Penicillium rubens]|nr:hypothetical protein E8E15_005334 [Penicillium rubens]